MVNILPLPKSKFSDVQGVVHQITSANINSDNIGQVINMWKSAVDAKLDTSHLDSTSLTRMVQFSDVSSKFGIVDADALQSLLTNAKNQNDLDAAKAPEVASWRNDSEALQASKLTSGDLPNLSAIKAILDSAGLTTPDDVTGAVLLLGEAVQLVPTHEQPSTPATPEVPAAPAATVPAADLGTATNALPAVPATPDLGTVTDAAPALPVTPDLSGATGDAEHLVAVPVVEIPHTL